jgi:hypothetical protein
MSRRTCDDANRVRRCFVVPTRTEPWRSTGRVALSGATVVGVTGLIAGCGSGDIFAALPMPLGSLIEPLRPLTFPGPGGTPLTPASWAMQAVARRVTNATANTDPLHPIANKSDPCRACAIGNRSVSGGYNRKHEEPAKFRLELAKGT